MTVEVDLDTPFARLIGETLAHRYKIESRIGEGAMGVVYRARHVKVGRTFAVKVLHSRLLEDNKTLQRFEREAELAGRLRHPNVIGVVDVGETTDGLRYMVMDFAAGPDLATVMHEAPMPPERIMRLTRQMLEGLYHAHEAGLIHRDFKPENVIIERDTNGHEVPRIVDFGIAILREGGDSPESPGRLTTNGLVLGTPHYMAPEQAVADPIDHRIDLFALGIIVYEMLCGKLPFDGSGAEVARANLLLDPPPIAERVPYLAIDPLLEAFARLLMAKKRDHRPRTAKAARELLDLIEEDREAAAKVLGVPATVAHAPQTTQEAAPVRHRGTGNETFPPPLRTDPVDKPTSTDALLSGELVPAKRRAPIIVAGVVGVGIVVAGAALLLGGRDQPETKVATAPQAMEATPTPVESPPPPVEPPPVEEANPPVEEATPPIEDAKPAVEQPPAPTPAKKPPKKTATKIQTSVETKPVETKHVEAKPAEHKPVDAGMLATQYKTVGAQLKALQDAKGPDAVSDLWARYRFIRLADAMATQQKRDEAAAVLAKLATEAAARKR